MSFRFFFFLKTIFREDFFHITLIIDFSIFWTKVLKKKLILFFPFSIRKTFDLFIELIDQKIEMNLTTVRNSIAASHVIEIIKSFISI